MHCNRKQQIFLCSAQWNRYAETNWRYLVTYCQRSKGVERTNPSKDRQRTMAKHLKLFPSKPHTRNGHNEGWKYFDLPIILVPHVKLEFSHFLIISNWNVEWADWIRKTTLQEGANTPDYQKNAIQKMHVTNGNTRNIPTSQLDIFIFNICPQPGQFIISRARTSWFPFSVMSG